MAEWILHLAFFVDTPVPKFKWGGAGGLSTGRLLCVVFFTLPQGAQHFFLAPPCMKAVASCLKVVLFRGSLFPQSAT